MRKYYKGYIISTFDTLNLPKDFLENLKTLEFKKMTDIQEKALPLALEGKDVIGQAKTGSGKTVTFSIPIVNKLDVKRFRIQSIVLAPTRELANQIAVEIRKLSRHIHNVKVLTLCGGVAYRPQVSSLFHGAHIVVGTPGRILKHINEENINLNEVNTLVLDEADKMLDMGFFEDIEKIINVLPKNRQSLLFSATYQENIENLSNKFMKNATIVKNENEEKVKIEQKFYNVNAENKSSLIPALISSNKAQSVLIFCNMKIQCDSLSDELYDLGLDVLTLHSDLDQKQRDETIVFFSNKSYPILIATDVASRGLHIDDIDLVINYDLARDVETHTHRIGRTARAGKGGLAISLCTINDEDIVDDLKDRFEDIKFDSVENVNDDFSYKIDSEYRTLFINGGKKQKLRRGDILGALTAGIGLQKDDIGKIDSMDFCSYVAVKKEVVKKALEGLSNNRIKGKYFKIYEK